MSRWNRQSRRTRVGRMFRRANWWQQAIVVLCVLIAAQGLYAVFIPPVRLADSALRCPPAVVAAVAGRGGLEIDDDSASTERAEDYDAACAATGRRWLLSGLLQIALATVWALATLELARLHRRRRRRHRRTAPDPAPPPD